MGVWNPLGWLGFADKIDLLLEIVVDPDCYALCVIIICSVVRIFVGFDFSSLFWVLEVLDAPVLKDVKVVLTNRV